jgi:hypothetical protein
MSDVRCPMADSEWELRVGGSDGSARRGGWLARRARKNRARPPCVSVVLRLPHGFEIPILNEERTGRTRDACPAASGFVPSRFIDGP